MMFADYRDISRAIFDSGWPAKLRPPSRHRSSNFLTKREVKSLNAGIEEFDLKRTVFYLALLANELIETKLSNLANPVRN